ncbi:DEAD/DEAH box helicase [Agaribacterium sp. ZY112]|uniref:DEAD/DEAH box helicase n=1 Tax=Agaribacterium sp. ZY112 TaxID=3233574 RepID=UPI003526AAEA
MRFDKLALSPPLLNALEELAYKQATEIQAKAIPHVLAGKDLIASAATGTGKTAAFVLPLLEKLNTGQKRRAKRMRALIVVPTRELAIQVNESIEQYAKHCELKSVVLVGGIDYAPQKQALIDGIDIVVATPGRLLDLAHQRALYFDELNAVVLDEADRILTMGFGDEINKIIDRLPSDRQSLLFSATLSGHVRDLAQDLCIDPIELLIGPRKQAPKSITQWLVAIDKHNKSSLLSHLISELNWQQAIIFIRTQHGAAKLVTQLEKRGIHAEAIHGGRSQNSRKQVISDFKSGKLRFLVATGVAARGLDIDELERVVNYDMPDDADEYIHRIGRTGRAGAHGEAVSLVSKDDFKRMCAIERRQDAIIERRIIEGFSVTKDLPASNLNFVLKRNQ